MPLVSIVAATANATHVHTATLTQAFSIWDAGSEHPTLLGVENNYIYNNTLQLQMCLVKYMYQ